MYGVDRQNTAHHPGAQGPDGDELAKRPVFELDGISPDPVCVVDDATYGHSTAGMMYALDPDSGEVLWQTERTGRPVLFDETVYGPTADGHVYGYDVETGDPWTSDVIEPATGLGRPIPTSEGLFITSAEAVWRIDSGTGAYTQVCELPPYVGGSSDWPAFGDETLYTARSSELHAVNVEAGEIDWIFEPAGSGSMADSNPAVGDGLVYVASRDRKLHGIDADSGDEVWAVDTDTRVEASPAIADGLVYLGERNRILVVDAKNGQIEWEADTLTGTPVDLVVADSTCYAASRFGIWAFDTSSQQLIWEYELPDDDEAGFIAPPTISDGTIYLPSTDETLYAIEDG